MCLNIRLWSIKKRAKKDIIVYKSVYKDDQLKDCYRTIYQKCLVKPGDTINAEIKVKRKIFRDKKFISRFIELGVHSFGNLYDAGNYSNIIIKCIIPKGTKYYKGLFHENYKCYVSESLFYTNEKY